MDKETMLNLFQRFYQGKLTFTRQARPYCVHAQHLTCMQAGGAGLGLAISAELVTLMGGVIGVVSANALVTLSHYVTGVSSFGYGRGSEFWLTLPVTYHNSFRDRNQTVETFNGEKHFPQTIQSAARVAVCSHRVTWIACVIIIAGSTRPVQSLFCDMRSPSCRWRCRRRLPQSCVPTAPWSLCPM